MADDDPEHDPDYQEFVDSMVKFCSCDYDRPCDSVLAAGPCERKMREDLDHPDFSDW